MTISDFVTVAPLKLGSQGVGVRSVQLALAVIGFKLKGTGYFGGATDTAVQAFQRARGLSPDGEVGPKTAAALDASARSPVRDVPAEVTAQPLWLVEAMKWVGTKEKSGPGDNPKIIEWAREEGGAVAKAYKHDTIPWCALFANMVLTKVGLKGTETLWALDFAGKWPSLRLDGPAVGAFAPMKRDGGGHIMVIVGRDRAGNIVGVGGNQSDAVNTRAFPLARLNQGFWWPSGVSLPASTGLSNLPIVLANGALSTREG